MFPRKGFVKVTLEDAKRPDGVWVTVAIDGWEWRVYSLRSELHQRVADVVASYYVAVKPCR